MTPSKSYHQTVFYLDRHRKPPGDVTLTINMTPDQSQTMECTSAKGAPCPPKHFHYEMTGQVTDGTKQHPLPHVDLCCIIKGSPG